MERLKVVALISGGKDSFFSILHCIACGHEVVALANLHPPLASGQDEIEDLDSYMYQTVGHAVIPLYEQALGLPLYRQEILGTALNQNREYKLALNDEQGRHDETEDLLLLLRKVVKAQPEVQAVSTGAILSDYQRTRVESVALHLGLTPLSYLWQYPLLTLGKESSLLEDMAAVGQDSRIVKVASGGLDESFLWQNVADSRVIGRLVKASQRFGTSGDGAILGEGGEFETLAIAGPEPLWKYSIVVEESDREVVIGDAGSACVRIAHARLNPKTEAAYSTDQLRHPPLLDEAFQLLLEECKAPRETIVIPAMSQLNTTLRMDQTPLTAHRLISDLTSVACSIVEQMSQVMRVLASRLDDIGHDLDDVVYTTLILRDMADFPLINKEYSQYFTEPNPPARVTIANPDILPEGCCISLSATSVHHKQPCPRMGLHVQSRSYWAPANIGPYSQAIASDASTELSDRGSIVYVAGQIPLVPASMTLLQSEDDDGFVKQAVLALQHLHRIGERMHVAHWRESIAFVTASSEAEACTKAEIARNVWLQASNCRSTADDPSEDEHAADFDVWNTINNSSSMGPQNPRADGFKGLSTQPFVIRAEALPRGAAIEWVGFGVTDEVANLHGLGIPHFRHLLRLFDRYLVR